MAIHTETRRSDRYIGDGSTVAFAFPFKLLRGVDAAVFVSSDGIHETQLDPSEYTVVLNADQDNNPGGVVVLGSALETGKVLVVASAQPYLQPAVFTNLGAFYPSNLNDSLDRLTIEAQQLLERLDRTVTVAVTSTMTPEELRDTLLEAKAEAEQLLEHTTQIDRLYLSVANIDTLTEHADNVDTVAIHITNVDRVAQSADHVDTVADHAANVDTVAGHISNVDRVAQSADNVDALVPHANNVDTLVLHTSEIDTVAGHISNVDRVSLSAANVDALVPHADNVDTLVSHTSEIDTVAGHIANVDRTARSADNIDALTLHATNIDTLAPRAADIGTLAPRAANIARLASSANNIDAVTEHASNIDTLAPHVANVDRVADDLSNVDIVAGNKANIDTVADNVNGVRVVATSINSVTIAADNINNLNNFVSRLTSAGEQAVSNINTAGTAKLDAITTAGDAQLAEARALIDHDLTLQEEVWTVQEAITAGTQITLPNEMSYVVGVNHLRLVVNGVSLMKPANFSEVGASESISTKFTLAFDLAAGDEIMAWTVPIGAITSEAAAAASAASAASSATSASSSKDDAAESETNAGQSAALAELAKAAAQNALSEIRSMVAHNIGMQEESWTASESVSAGTSITLPNGMTYVVGANHLRLAVNGVILMKPANFQEEGTATQTSSTFTLGFDLAPGDEVMAWTIPIGGVSNAVTLDSAQTVTGAKTFTGDLTAVTQLAGDSSTKVATTAFVMQAIAAALSNSPSAEG